MREKNKAVSSKSDLFLKKKNNLKKIADVLKNAPEDFPRFPNPPPFSRERHIHAGFFLYIFCLFDSFGAFEYNTVYNIYIIRYN